MRARHLGLVALVGITVLGAGCSDEVLTIRNLPPTARIDAPLPGFVATPGDPVTLRGVVEDSTSPPDALRVVWESSQEGELLDGFADAEGITELEVSTLSLGAHTISLRVWDEAGASVQDTVTIEILAPKPVNTPPTAPGVELSPAEPLPDEALNCRITTPSTDVDGDEITYSFLLTRGGDVLAEWADGTVNDELVITADATAAGDEFVCAVTPNDGEEDGPTGTDSATVVCPVGSGLAMECPGISCRTILGLGATPSGAYWVTAGTAQVFEVPCDMETDGGGWTGITWPLADTVLGASMTALEAGTVQGTAAATGPYTQDTDGAHAYQLDWPFPAGFDAFRLGEDYVIASNACVGPTCTCGAAECTADVDGTCFVQSDWTQGYAPPGCGSYGDVSFGSPSQSGPSTSLASYFATPQAWLPMEQIPWPVPASIFPVDAGATAFRVAWGETGGEDEGWFPWFGGTIWLR